MTTTPKIPSLIATDVLAVRDQVFDELAGAGGPQDAGIVLLLKDHGLVAHHHAVALRLLVHVGVVALALAAQMELAVAHLVHLHLQVGAVQLQPVVVRTGLGARNLG